MHLFFLIHFVHSSPHPSEFVASFKMGVLGQNLIDFFGKLQRCVAHHWIWIEQDSPFLVSFVPYACVWALFLLKKTHTHHFFSNSSWSSEKIRLASKPH